MKKRNLILGIGSTGAKAIQLAFRRADGCAILPIALDTDTNALEKIDLPNKMDLSSNDSLGSLLDRLDPACYSWLSFYGKEGRTRVECAESARIDVGSGGWRAKAVLAFAAFCADEQRKAALHAAVDELFQNSEEGNEFELYVAASLAGGTGSGLLLPVTLYIKRYISEKYGVRIPTAALLLMPEIFTGFLPGMQATIANANAYAAVRELNAVNRTAWGKTTSTEPRFAIGDANDPALGLLFDSTAPQFQTPEALPFDRVYLYGKRPGIDSVDVQVNTFSDILSTLCKSNILQDAQKAAANLPQAVYTGISIARMQTGAPGVGEYLGLKTVSDFFAGFGKLAKTAEGRLLAALRESEGRRSRSADIFGYLNTVLDTDADASIFADDQSFAEVDTIDEVDEVDEDEKVARYSDPYFADLLFPIEEFICAEEIEPFFKKLSKPILPAKNRLRAKERRALILSEAKSDIEELQTIFLSGYAAVEEAKESLIAKVFDQVIKAADGSFENPETALVGFCKLYRYLANKSHPIKKEIKEENIRDLFYLGENHLLADIIEQEESKRNVDPRHQLALEKYESEVLQDAREKLSFVKQILIELVYGSIRDTLLSLIGKYRLIFKKVFFSAAVANEDLKILLYSADVSRNSARAIYSSEDYQYFYTKYQKEHANEIDIPPILGEQFFAYACANDDLHAYNGAGIVRAVQEKVVEAILAGSYYKETVDAGMISAFAYKCGREKAFAEKTVALLCQLAKPTLKTAKLDEDSPSEPYGEAGYLILPSNAPENADLAEQARNYGLGLLAISEKRSLALLRETSAWEVESLGAFNECSAEADCFRAYEQSLRNARNFVTPVWYPHIVGNMEYQNQLPFLSAEKQTQYDRDTTRALLYALMRGIFSVDRAPEGKKEILYFRGNDGSRLPVAIGEKPLSRDDWHLLPFWLRRREDKIQSWSKLYAETLDHDLRALPSISSANSKPTELLRAINASGMIRTFKTNLFDQVVFFGKPVRMGILKFAYRVMLAETSAGGEQNAPKLLAEWLDVLRSFCFTRIPKTDAEMRRLVLEEIENAFFDSLRQSRSKETEDIINWVKETAAL